MKTLTNNDRATERIRAGERMTVTGAALVDIEGVEKVSVSGTRVFGPYTDDVLVIVSAFGTVTMSVTAPDDEVLPPPARFATDANGNVTGLVGPGGPVLYGEMVSGTWMKCPSIFRLRLTGTGTVTIDAKDSLGDITTGVASYTVSGATDQIEFPYAGNNAVAIRATFTGDITVEVL